jgi:hypothetical protein
MQHVVDIAARLGRYGRQAGPYLMLEALLPGGSLFALALYLYRRARASRRP